MRGIHMRFLRTGIHSHFLGEVLTYILPPVNGVREGGQVNFGLENSARAVSLAAGFSVVTYDLCCEF